MRVFLKKGLEDKFVFNPKNSEEFKYSYNGLTVYSLQSSPWIDVQNGVEFAKDFIEEGHFVKATILETQVRFNGPRLAGIYEFGTARAELKKEKGNIDSLMMETSSWKNGIADMMSLRELVWGGAITPVLSYEAIQGEQSQFNILKYFLGKEKLSFWRRFLLCWKVSLIA